MCRLLSVQAYLALLQQVIVSVCKVSPHRRLYLCSLHSTDRVLARKLYAFQRSLREPTKAAARSPDHRPEPQNISNKLPSGAACSMCSCHRHVIQSACIHHITHAHLHMLNPDNSNEKHSKLFPAHDELGACRTCLASPEQPDGVHALPYCMLKPCLGSLL